MKYRLIFLLVLTVFDEPLCESNIERQVKISASILEEGTYNVIIYLLSNSKTFTHGVKILEFKSNWRHQDFAKSIIYMNHSNQAFLEGSNFWGLRIWGEGKIFWLQKC